MFESLKSKANKSTNRNTTRKAGKELPRTIAFLRELVKIETRLTYAALADAAEQLGEHEPSGLSAGQRGSSLVKHLPVELQPHICRGNGRYAKGTEWDTEVPSNLRKRDYIRPEAVGEFVAAFIRATDEVDPETGEPVDEDVEVTGIDPLDLQDEE